jgi:hypothetical protein
VPDLAINQDFVSNSRNARQLETADVADSYAQPVPAVFQTSTAWFIIDVPAPAVEAPPPMTRGEAWALRQLYGELLPDLDDEGMAGYDDL